MSGATTTPEVKLLCLCAGDPTANRPFSGSARALFSALDRLGCVHAAANVLGWTDPFALGAPPIRLLRKLDRFGVEERYRWSPLSWWRNTKRAHAVAEGRPGFNAVLMYGTTYNPEVDVPKYVYLDATSAQVSSAHAWEFAHFTDKRVRRVIDYQDAIFRGCTAVFPRSQWTADSLRNDYHLPDNKIVVAGAGSNIEDAPLPHGPYDRARILFIGVEWERKGGPLLVEAFRKVRQALPHATLAIVGCTPQIDEPGVEIIGRIPKGDPGGKRRLLEEYQKASVFCIMSEYEPFGIVMIEAQASGVPCVAPNRYAFPETIQEGKTGALVEEYNADLLSQALLALLSDPVRLAAMGEAARQWVAEQWTWDRAAQRIRDRVAKDLVDGAGRPINA